MKTQITCPETIIKKNSHNNSFVKVGNTCQCEVCTVVGSIAKNHFLASFLHLNKYKPIKNIIMKYLIMFLTILMFAVFSCSKDKMEPISSFSLKSDTISTLKVGTSDEFWVASKSINSDSVLWDFGDGRKSKDTTFLLSYPKSGTYTLKLIAKNNNGEISETSKKIIVLDRVLKRIDIYYTQWDSTNYTEPWPRTNAVDIYFQMQKYTDVSYNSDGFYSNCPILYTSSTIKNVSNKFTSLTGPTYVINVSDKIIIDKNLVQFAPGNINNAYLFSIMGKDSSGKTYRITNNAISGFSFGIIKDDISKNTFIAMQGGFTYYNLICDFE